MMNDMSVADVAAVTRNNDGWGDGSNSWIWIILVFACLFGGFGNFGGNERTATTGDVQRGFDTQTLNSKIDALGTGLDSRLEGINGNMYTSAYENARLIDNAALANANGFNQTQMAIMQNGNGIQSSLTTGFDNMAYQMAQNRYAQQECCCETKQEIMQNRYENAQNTTAITNAIHQEGELTRGLIQANTVQDLRDRLEEKDRLYQAANFQISQVSQTQNIVNSLRPYPVAAYLTASPYQTVYPYYGTTVGTAYTA